MIGAGRALLRCAESRRQHPRWNIPVFVAAGGVAAATFCSSQLIRRSDEPESDVSGGNNVQQSRIRHEDHNCPTPQFSSRPFFVPIVVSCEAAVKAAPDGDSHHSQEETGMRREEEDFLDTLGLYQRWLKEIKKQWAISSPSSIKWPNNIPQKSDVSALEMDLQMYLKGDQANTRLCQDLEFRIASYYLFREDSIEQQRKGFNIIKKLAVNGHPDGLCLYAMIWNHGGVAGIEAKPQLAVKYWRQAADAGHLASMYELAVALYVGDGAVEDPKQAVKYLIKAADLGHSGAAYLLADFYLDGVGVERSRARALEWLMTAAEMGHRQAQRRAEILLTSSMQDGRSSSSDGTTSSASLAKNLKDDESVRWCDTRPGEWYRSISLERRFTIGGGSRNPKILLRRKTAVAESRRSEE